MPILDLTTSPRPAAGQALSPRARQQLRDQLIATIRRTYPGEEGEARVREVLQRWAARDTVACCQVPVWHPPGECRALPRCESPDLPTPDLPPLDWSTPA